MPVKEKTVVTAEQLSRFEAKLKACTLFTDFEHDIDTSNYGGDPVIHHTFILIADHIKLEMRIEEDCELMVWGSTHYKFENAWYCFDRVGIDCSFSNDWEVKDLDEYDIETAILEQWERCEKRIAERKAAGPVVATILGRWSLTQERLDYVKKQLATKGYYRFTPHGMGTACLVYKGRKRSRWDDQLDPEQAKMLGCDKLFVERQDWD